MRKIIISAFLAVLGMPIDMYGERRRRDLQACRPNVQYMAGLERAQGIRWRLNYIHSMKYAEVINASIAANSAGIDYRWFSLEACINHIIAPLVSYFDSLEFSRLLGERGAKKSITKAYLLFLSNVLSCVSKFNLLFSILILQHPLPFEGDATSFALPLK